MKKIVMTAAAAWLAVLAPAAVRAAAPDVAEPKNVTAVGVTATPVVYEGRRALQVRLAQEGPGDNKPTYALVNGVSFQDGTIEVDVAGKPGPWAGPDARGFIGVAFRTAADNSRFEAIYIRPTNGRAEDQLRRNRSVQYISAPDFPWHKLRQETPGKYESYVDLVPGAWTHLKIVVAGQSARLFVGKAEQPVLIVNDLKMGAGASGGVGMWVDAGTDGHFANLKVTPAR